MSYWPFIRVTFNYTTCRQSVSCALDGYAAQLTYVLYLFHYSQSSLIFLSYWIYWRFYRLVWSSLSDHSMKTIINTCIYCMDYYLKSTRSISESLPDITLWNSSGENMAIHWGLTMEWNPLRNANNCCLICVAIL